MVRIRYEALGDPGLFESSPIQLVATGAADASLTLWDKAAALLRSSVTAQAVLNAVTVHPQVLLGVLAGVVLTAVVHTVRRIRRVITTGVVMAIAGGGAAGGRETLLQYLPHWH